MRCIFDTKIRKRFNSTVDIAWPKKNILSIFCVPFFGSLSVEVFGPDGRLGTGTASIDRSACNMYSQTVQSVGSRLWWLGYCRTQTHILLTIYHYKVKVKDIEASFQAAGGE